MIIILKNFYVSASRFYFVFPAFIRLMPYVMPYRPIGLSILMLSKSQRFEIPFFAPFPEGLQR
jgi:hypothetical protein